MLTICHSRSKILLHINKKVRTPFILCSYRGVHFRALKEEGENIKKDEFSNVTSSILSKLDEKIHLIPGHPLCHLKERIQSFLPGFTHYDQFSPIVTVDRNFDRLLVKADHPGRSKSDSFYFNKTRMLRTHTTTHEIEIYEEKKVDKFTISADVYRRDEIDSSHYPVFHQMECVHLFDIKKLSTLNKISMEAEKINKGIKVLDPTRDLNNLSANNPIQAVHGAMAASYVAEEMKKTLNMVLYNLFGATSGTDSKQPLEIRWIEAFFPFTSPSWEVEILYQGKWLEVLGCGVLQQEILNNSGRNSQMGWACGMGLERLAMVLHKIPDIRLFWSKDDRFLKQFSNQSSKPTIFQPFSKYPPCTRDIAFWSPPEGFVENDLCDIIRDIAGDIVESVTLIDTFVHPKTLRESKCYRIVYRSMDRNVTNEEINELQEQVRQRVKSDLNAELR